MIRSMTRLVGVSVAITLLGTAAPGAAEKRGKRDERRNMELVGLDDLQARSAYQPVVHRQGDRWIAYVGHHGGEAQNKLTGKVEPNGTSIVDVTDPRHPRYLHHIPGPAGAGEAGGAQMVRACSARDLPHADRNGDPGRAKHYLLRATGNSHEVYDVTDPANPALVKTVVANLGNTHKSWWECDTGIAYLVSDGRKLSQASPSFPDWRTPRMTQIFDLSNPAEPVFIRNYGLVGQEPGSSGPVPTAVHGMISLGGRVYFGHGTGADGVFQIADREKLLDPTKCPTPPSKDFRTSPTTADLLCPQIGRLDTQPSGGAHTVFPVLGVAVPEFAKNTQGHVRDFVVLVNESMANDCKEPRQMVYLVEITDPTRPSIVSNFQVPEASGGFCGRGGRFGSHSSNESFTPFFYKKLVFVSWFNAGVRAIDIRDPLSPREAGFYVPATTASTAPRPEGCTAGTPGCKIAIQTNNVEVDERGFVYVVDRANTGLHVLKLTGDALAIVSGKKETTTDAGSLPRRGEAETRVAGFAREERPAPPPAPAARDAKADDCN
jgi:hypothetical protein